MARLDIANLLWPAAVGAISGGAELFSQNHVAKPPAGGVNDLMANAGLAIDVILPVAATLNHVTDALVKGQASSDMLAASMAIGMRRLTTFVGHKVLKLNVTPSPGAYGAYGTRGRTSAPRARQVFDQAYVPSRVETAEAEHIPITYSVT